MIKTFAQLVGEYLDAGLISAKMANGNWWKCRRNGATKTWVRTPGRFRIPISMGIYHHDYLTNETTFCFRNETQGDFSVDIVAGKYEFIVAQRGAAVDVLV